MTRRAAAGPVKSIIASLALAAAPCAAAAADEITHRPDAQNNGGERLRAEVDALLAKMTLAEKIGQLNLLTSAHEFAGPAAAEDAAGLMTEIAAGRVGAVFNAYTVAYARRFQKIAVSAIRQRTSSKQALN
ncbi:MAG: hypothetical protein ACOZAA_07110 [Pseudomonadota bacterium]